MTLWIYLKLVFLLILWAAPSRYDDDTSGNYSLVSALFPFMNAN